MTIATKFELNSLLDDLPLHLPGALSEKIYDKEVFRSGDLSLFLFAPSITDDQTTHQQDEIYVIVSGHGELAVENEVFQFQNGDSFFIKAGTRHHFINFSADFACWAIFCGDCTTK